MEFKLSAVDMMIIPTNKPTSQFVVVIPLKQKTENTTTKTSKTITIKQKIQLKKSLQFDVTKQTILFICILVQ